MPVITITQLHLVGQAKRELLSRGMRIVAESEGMPRHISYEEDKPAKKTAAKKP